MASDEAPEVLAGALSDIARMLLAEEPLGGTLQRITDLCCASVRGCLRAEISLHDGRVAPVMSSAPDVATQADARDALLIPIVAGSHDVGVLTMSSASDGEFADSALALGAMFAAQAAIAVSTQELKERSHDIARQMEEALESRAVIDQAKGIVMARRLCDADTAFAVLRGLSQRANRKVRDVAGEIIARTIAGEGLPFERSAT